MNLWKNLSKCSRTHFCHSEYITFIVQNSSPKIGLFLKLKTQPKINNRPIAENWPNPVTLQEKEGKKHNDKSLGRMTREFGLFFGVLLNPDRTGLRSNSLLSNEYVISSESISLHKESKHNF
jgi:hypothetical protein